MGRGRGSSGRAGGPGPRRAQNQDDARAPESKQEAEEPGSLEGRSQGGLVTGM